MNWDTTWRHGAIMAFIAKFEGCYSPLQVHDSKRRAAGAAGKTAQISSAKGRGCNSSKPPALMISIFSSCFI